MAIGPPAGDGIRPMLEVIDRGAWTDCHPVPLLFVHGGWHGAWCWDEYFLEFFADMGYRALALSLRGHGNSPTAKPLRDCSLADYVDDVASVANTLPTPPAVIGHSMGGFIVQKYLEKHTAPAGVLVASIPPQGSLRFTTRVMRRIPWLAMTALVTGRSLRCLSTPELVRDALFSACVPECDVVRFAAMLQDESRRVALDVFALNLPKPDRVSAPLLVLGAARDGSITTEEVRATARAYHTEAEIFPDMGHDMMLEPAWAAVAERIHTWLGARGL